MPQSLWSQQLQIPFFHVAGSRAGAAAKPCGWTACGTAATAATGATGIATATASCAGAWYWKAKLSPSALPSGIATFIMPAGVSTCICMPSFIPAGIVTSICCISISIALARSSVRLVLAH